ncbi:DUF3572 domain-containing protein [Neomegalonema sp.]|uniref:DUF3572 domain-containing protein n=1 Tax=Neomegalonema sp. TaxID=2039713 RepID=UPI00261CE8BA|nr:DUF3572 domain-containing protein [Neomegalonema sp.]MDD2868155.1 DUF3572 domain-containing protein [Neomegalonema sp.]
MKSRPNREEAETVALRALAWTAAEPERLNGFLAFSGLAPGDLGAAARDPAALGGLLDWLLADESALLAFCAEARLAPEEPMAARAALPGFSGDLTRDWA